MSTKSKLIKEINLLGKIVKRKSEWKSSKRPFGYFENKDEDNYIYEFFCYVSILKDLKTNYTIKYIPGNNKFPRNPAYKKNIPYFEITCKSSNTKYQVCAGTKIKIKSGDTIAPDISFQMGNSPIVPESKHIILIMDAKYTIKPESRLKFDIIKTFAMNAIDLKALLASRSNINFNKFLAFKSNCLLTNGLASDKPAYCKLKKIKQIEKFKHSQLLIKG